jgi:mxaA protein
MLLLLNSAFLQAADTPGRVLQLDQGRSYGLVVGDLIQHHYVVEVDDAYALTQSSLPVAGELSYWLELRDVQFSSTQRGDKNLYRLDLTYQTFYAPLDVRMLEIPAIQLDFSNEEKNKFSITLDKWSFTMSPIKEINPGGVGNENDASSFMKKAVAPRAIPLRPAFDDMLLYGALLLLTSVILLTISGWLPSLNRSPFIRAQKKIRQRRKASNGDALQTSQACLQAVHEAINQRAGQTVFASQLDLFLYQQPQFASLRKPLTQFFQQSQDCFFLDKPVSPDIIDDCVKLCGQLANADKVSTKS